MTRLDYIKLMTAEELVNYMFFIMIPKGKEYNHSILGLIEWLKEIPTESQLYNEQQFLSQLVRK